MPEYACRIRIRNRDPVTRRLTEEFRSVLASAENGQLAQVLAIGEVMRECPGAMVSGHGPELVTSDPGALEVAQSSSEPKKGGWPKGKPRKAA